MNTRIQRVILTFVYALLSVPFASAYTGFRPLDNVVRIMADFFTVPALENEYVQLGVIKFMLFLALFAIFHMALKRVFDNNRVAGIVGFVFAFLGVFLMPRQWVLATGGTITALIGGGIILGLIGAGLWIAMMKLKGDFVRHFLGFVLLFVLLQLIIIFKMILGLPMPGQYTLGVPVFMVGIDWLMRKWR